MPNINDRIGSQNVIRVLSNASAPPTRIVNLTDVESSRKTEDGMILVWDLSTEKFFMTDTIDSAGLTVTGIATFSNTTQSSSISTGALVVNGGVGIAKEVHIGEGITVSGISTFSSALDINAAVDILNGLKVNQTFESVGITTLASAGGITTTGGNLFVGAGLTVANNLKINGTSEFIGNATFRGGTIGIGDSTSDDIDIGGEFVSNLVPNTDNTYDIGITTQRWRDGKFAGLVTSTNLNVSGVATFNSVDLNGDVDIDGRTDLDEVAIAGITTFNNDVIFQGAAASQNITFDHSENDLEFSDLSRAKFGNNDDLEIWHGTGNNSHIKNSTNDLKIRSDSLILKRADDSEAYLKATVNQDVKLYYNGNEKFATTGAGVTVLGTAETQNLNVTGLSTFTGIVTTVSDLYVGGDLYVADDLTFDEFTARNATVTGIATIGTLGVTGLTTTQNLRVAGLSTFVGVATFSTNVFVAGTLDAGLIDGGEF
jgi:hypothetical protein